MLTIYNTPRVNFGVGAPRKYSPTNRSYNPVRRSFINKRNVAAQNAEAFYNHFHPLTSNSLNSRLSTCPCLHPWNLNELKIVNIILVFFTYSIDQK